MRKTLKKLLSFGLSLALLVASLTSVTASSAGMNETYNYDVWGEAIPSQAGYTADRAVSGSDIGAGSFDTPSDIFFAGDDTLYTVHGHL